MKHVDVEKLVLEAIPVLTTRKEKLRYAAMLIRKSKLPHLHLYHNLERMPKSYLDQTTITPTQASFFGIMLSDPHLKAAGVGDTIGKQMRFFQLSQEELHEFSCDCGGAISNSDMADTVDSLADGAPVMQPSKTIFEIAASWFGY